MRQTFHLAQQQNQTHRFLHSCMPRWLVMLRRAFNTEATQYEHRNAIPVVQSDVAHPHSIHNPQSVHCDALSHRLRYANEATRAVRGCPLGEWVASCVPLSKSEGRGVTTRTSRETEATERGGHESTRQTRRSQKDFAWLNGDARHVHPHLAGDHILRRLVLQASAPSGLPFY